MIAFKRDWCYMAKKPISTKRDGVQIGGRVPDKVAKYLDGINKVYNMDKIDALHYGLQLIAEKHELDFPQEHVIKYVPIPLPVKK